MEPYQRQLLKDTYCPYSLGENGQAMFYLAVCSLCSSLTGLTQCTHPGASPHMTVHVQLHVYNVAVCSGQGTSRTVWTVEESECSNGCSNW